MSDNELHSRVRRIETRLTKLLLSHGVNPYNTDDDSLDNPVRAVLIVGDGDNRVGISAHNADTTLSDILKVAYANDLSGEIPIHLGTRKIGILHV